MKELIEEAIAYQRAIGPELAAFVDQILEWDDDIRIAYKFAYRLINEKVELEEDER